MSTNYAILVFVCISKCSMKDTPPSLFPFLFSFCDAWEVNILRFTNLVVIIQFCYFIPVSFPTFP